VPNSLTPILLQRLAESPSGSIPIRDFIEIALYHPDHGYYTSGKSQIGRTGDFFTSVSVGPLFGTLLASQFAELWEKLGQPTPFTIVEQGAHRGDCAHDLLTALQLLSPPCYGVTQYQIIEPSLRLRSAQIERLANFPSEKLRWFSSLEALPAFTGVHFSNELLDAFPVHSVVFNGDEWSEIHIKLDQEKFQQTERPIINQKLRSILQTLPKLPAGYQTEVNLAALSWIELLETKLTRGFVFIIDYGFSRAEYYRPERTSGTLTGYANHRRVADLLAHPGEVDITAHLDFTSLAEHALAAGLQIAGFTDQHHFIVALGASYFREPLPSTPEKDRELRAFKTLMHPQIMGQKFQVLALHKQVSPTPLAGFTFARDFLITLGISSKSSD